MQVRQQPPLAPPYETRPAGGRASRGAGRARGQPSQATSATSRAGPGSNQGTEAMHIQTCPLFQLLVAIHCTLAIRTITAHHSSPMTMAATHMAMMELMGVPVCRFT